ncbi:hypothetical protein OM076_03310 [Solirubrobacter ginsenosidimutans]|uniref:Uncharacterized protein n=1 Tax=Solirubrobacter ginsenosidimutans TaxID=490573 RepID=A0A9X3S3A6_9ACTN|nr:hypothetical protein [Solirubrobacter ginsenosidimutans]MDA0159283.1 hypothetical protein [Solirubrobacter ginsenosidimutans]
MRHARGRGLRWRVGRPRRRNTPRDRVANPAADVAHAGGRRSAAVRDRTSGRNRDSGGGKPDGPDQLAVEHALRHRHEHAVRNGRELAVRNGHKLGLRNGHELAVRDRHEHALRHRHRHRHALRNGHEHALRNGHHARADQHAAAHDHSDDDTRADLHVDAERERHRRAERNDRATAGLIDAVGMDPRRPRSHRRRGRRPGRTGPAVAAAQGDAALAGGRDRRVLPGAADRRSHRP